VDGLISLGDVEIVALPPEQQLEQPERWIIRVTEKSMTYPAVQATAMSIVDGWLILWRFSVAVAAFRPGAYTGAYAG